MFVCLFFVLLLVFPTKRNAAVECEGQQNHVLSQCFPPPFPPSLPLPLLQGSAGVRGGPGRRRVQEAESERSAAVPHQSLRRHHHRRQHAVSEAAARSCRRRSLARLSPLTLGRSSAPQVSDLLQRLRQRGQAEDAALLPRLSRQVYRPVAEGDAGLHFTSSPFPPHPAPPTQRPIWRTHSVQWSRYHIRRKGFCLPGYFLIIRPPSCLCNCQSE